MFYKENIFCKSGEPTPAPETVEDQEGCEGEGEEEEVLEEDMCVDEAWSQVATTKCPTSINFKFSTLVGL